MSTVHSNVMPKPLFASNDKWWFEERYELVAKAIAATILRTSRLCVLNAAYSEQPGGTNFSVIWKS